MRKFWEFRAAAADDGEPATGELLLYGPFGSDDAISEMLGEVNGRQFRADLDALGDVDEIRIYVNSIGGDVFTGQAIHSALARHPARVVAFIDGICASAATLPVMAAERVVMPKGATMMVHKPWTITVGNDTDHDRTAQVLRTIKKSMIPVYQAKTGLDEAKIESLLQARDGDGTWMTAQEAVDLGFADEIEQVTPVKAAIVRPGILAVNDQEFDISRYRNLPMFPEVPEAERDAGRGKPTKRDAERALREAGFSRDAIKQALAEGWREPLREAAEPTPDRAKARLRFETDRLLARAARIGVPA